MTESKISDYESAKRMSGRIMLCGMMALFSGMLLSIIGFALEFGSKIAIGSIILTIGKLLLASWLILLFVGIAARMSIGEEPVEPSAKDDSHNSSAST